ncbi:hypothetical protein SUGI_0570450 [Cryptomeria japonica]|nr:hypothetical protein SUGI_0570450 [Cryptomeria japonica]
MERFKSDAARRELIGIQIATENSEFKFEQVIDKIGRKEEDIKRCYDKGTQFKGEVLLWMVARDACFILEFFRNHLCGVHEDEEEEDDDDKSFKNDFEFPPKLHPIFGHKSENPGTTEGVVAKDSICSQLKNGGVKFLADAKIVDNIRYEGKTLTLVPLKLDVDSEVYIRNLIALEICSPDYKHKRMTAYCQFMYELCQTDKGVYVMRKNGLIIGNLWYSKRVIRLLSVSNLTITQPACKSIKETREKLSSCYKTRRSILLRSLWTEFWNACGSKPWLVLGGFGATLVLCRTAIQVFCLFKHCGA